MHETVLYNDPFLKQVVARIDFVTPLAGLEKTLPTKLGNVLTEHFPIAEPTESLAFQIEFNVGSGAVQDKRTPIKVWNFYGKDREKQLSLGPPNVFVSQNSYSTYEELKEDFGSVVNALDATFPDTKAGRFGLRYVNIIESDGLPTIKGWEEFIAQPLVGSIAFFDPAKLTRLIHVAEMKCGDLTLRFQFGLPNPDYPSVIKRPSFVLDLDAYVEAAHPLAISLQYMEQAHECIQHVFEQSITDKLRERMNVKTAVQE